MNLRRKIIKWSIIIFIIVASGGAILNSILSKRINRDFIVGLLESEGRFWWLGWGRKRGAGFLASRLLAR